MWRDWKCDLRCKVYDKYNTDAERKNALPPYLNREDCESFVNLEGTYDAKSRRRAGKAARASLKSPHTFGRKGQARVADKSQQEHPEREVTRCEVFIKTHYKKDGTASSHHVVFGIDTPGRVRGLGLGVSRSVVHHSNPYKRAYEEEHKSHVALETEVDGLKSRMADMEKIVASLSQNGTQMRSSNDHESSSRVRSPSTHQGTQPNSRTTLPGTYKLMHLRKSTVVAHGSLIGVSPDNSYYNRIVIVEIVDGEIELMDGVRQMEDIMLADIIDWPTFRTFPC